MPDDRPWAVKLRVANKSQRLLHCNSLYFTFGLVLSTVARDHSVRIINNTMLQRMKKKGDHRPRNSAQYERVVKLLIIYAQGNNGHRDKFRCYRRFHDQSRSSDNFEIWPDFRSCLMIDLGRETDGNNESCLGVRFCLVHNTTTVKPRK